MPKTRVVGGGWVRSGVVDAPELHPAVEPLGFLLGTWRGEGEGEYPGIEPFTYAEEVEFWHVGKPFLGYHQKTTVGGVPSHTETGFWRVASAPGAAEPVAVEVTITQPTGISEVLVGELRDRRIELATIEVVRTPTAKEVTEVRRVLRVAGDTMTYELAMAAVGQPLGAHLAATLSRVG